METGGTAVMDRREPLPFEEGQTLRRNVSRLWEKNNRLRNVICIDDDLDQLAIFKSEMVRMNGSLFEWHTFQFQQRAYEYIMSERPDAIVIDINMPEGNGLDFIMALPVGVREECLIIFASICQQTLKRVKADTRTKGMLHFVKGGDLEFIYWALKART